MFVDGVWVACGVGAPGVGCCDGNGDGDVDVDVDDNVGARLVREFWLNEVSSLIDMSMIRKKKSSLVVNNLRIDLIENI